MKYRQNLHTHSVFCDGRDTCEATVLRALELGFEAIGFSGHSSMYYSPSHGMSEDGTVAYREEVARLKAAYRDRITVFCGIEFDMYSEVDLTPYDYVIGTLHYLRIGDEKVGFDRSADEVARVISTYFAGDGLAYAKEYYRQFATLPDYGRCDIVGHFDIITKHAENEDFFDRNDPVYRRAATECLHTLADRGLSVFEVNTGAISRGYRKTPYPDPFLLREMREMGLSVTLGSDCHDNRFLDCAFPETLDLLRECGFRSVLSLTENGWREDGLE